MESEPVDIEKIRQHYIHAKEKHPHFCDALTYHTSYGVRMELGEAREELSFDAENQSVTPLTVLKCEAWEIIDAVIRGDKEQAVEECYDAIAVILRVVDVLEGRQPIGERAAEEGGE